MAPVNPTNQDFMRIFPIILQNHTALDMSPGNCDGKLLRKSDNFALAARPLSRQ